MASISRGTGVRVFVAFPIIQNDHLWGVVYLSRTPQSILKHLYAKKEQVIIIVFLLLSVTLFLALLTSYTISRPLLNLVRKTKQLATGEIKSIEETSGAGVTEIELLSQEFSKMAKSLHDRSDYIREFAMHVSHEFKTPITSIQGSAELLLEHLNDMDDAKKKKFLSNIIADTDRLKNLVSRLLEVAEVDNVIPVKGSASLENVLKDLKDRYAIPVIKIDIQTEQDLTIPIAKDYLETIFCNLFDNAKQHGASEVSINVNEKEDFVVVKVLDNGTGISLANEKKIFTPFFTTKREDGGTGLGLGIVKSLLKAHGGSIYVLESSQGACFELEIPIV